MSVIIRLQNLPWSANALDIRQYFHGLSIPEGGVHIVGGELGDAFIAFSTDEDARQAFALNNGKIKEVQIKLMLSSRTEMQKVIEAARNQSLAAFMQTTTTPVQMQTIMPSMVPAAVPEIKKETSKERESRDSKSSGDRRDKRRSRSRSRDRKDRSRERDRRDRRHRDRSRSKSRERRDRRRRDRSRSRDRTRSRDRDRKSSKRMDDRSLQKDLKPRIGVWEIPQAVEPQLQPNQIINPFAVAALEDPRRTLGLVLNQANQLSGDRNLFQAQQHFSRARESWPPTGRAGSNNNHIDLDADNGDERMLKTGSKSLLGNFNPLFQEPGFNRNVSGRTDNLGRFEKPDMDRAGENTRNCCIQLQPFFGGYGEIRRFFQGLFINNTGIKFVNDEFGKRMSVVYIRFAFPDGKEQALKKNGAILKGQIVEVTHLDDEEFESAIDRFQPDYNNDESNTSEHFRSRNVSKYSNNHHNSQSVSQNLKVYSCLVVEELPSFAKEQDIFKMFSDYSLESILMSSRPRNNHVAYVKFCNADDAKKAFADKSKHIFEGKPVHIRPCADEEFKEINNPPEEIVDEEGDSETNDSKFAPLNTNCLHVTGLPVKISDRDVSDFFSDVGVVPVKVHLINGRLGFTGQAYCEFSSEHDTSVGLEKDETVLGTNLISVKPVTRQEMLDVLMSNQKSVGNGLPPHQGPNLNSFPRPFFMRNSFGLGPRGPGFGRPPMGRRFLPPSVNLNDVPPGCTILMENVPYKAGLDEILEFFSGYDIPNDNVLRRFNDNGTPSGEAKVIFNSLDEAYQAMNEKRGHKIRDRMIYLSQC